MVALKLCLFFFSVLLAYVNCAYDPGPLVIATKGEVWPKPRNQTRGSDYFVIRPSVFNFSIIGHTCAILKSAVDRYEKIISKENSLERRGRLAEVKLNFGNDYEPWRKDKSFAGNLDVLPILLQTPCEDNELPTLAMNEEYSLIVGINNQTLLSAKTIWGVLRGMETFSQLIHLADDLKTFILNSTFVHDYPRFPHRGLLLDTSRHFLPLHSLFTSIDAMAYNKLNVFHWHVTDEQSFPYQSIAFPILSEKGSYHPVSKVYSQADVQKVIEYARIRGIRVMPEFDTPGHTGSWGLGIPELLSPCRHPNGTLTGKFGPMDPTKNFTYSFLEDLFKEIVDVFPEAYVHLGGDEVEFDCWKTNPEINEWMDWMNITGDYKALESYYIQKLINIVDNYKASSLVWEEVFVNGVTLPNTTVVHVWKPYDYMGVINQATKAGKPVLLSACWYLDQLANGGDWRKFYTCEPYDFPGTDAQKNLVMGGEVCMWGEVVNENNVESRVWPRASAPAEKLWSEEDADDINYAARRLEEHTCRMNNRGIHAQPPNGAGFCL